MKLRVETTYIAGSDYGERIIPAGGHVRLVFQDGSYHAGDVEAISEESITISRSDGEYTYPVCEIRDIEVR